MAGLAAAADAGGDGLGDVGGRYRAQILPVQAVVEVIFPALAGFSVGAQTLR